MQASGARKNGGVETPPPQRVLIMGAGALGSVIGGLLAAHGHAVTLIGRAPHMEAITEKGLRISGIWGAHQVATLTCHTSPEACAGQSFDWVILAVKSYDTAAAMHDLAPLVGPETLVCAYQNGLGNAELIAAQIGWERTVGARVIYGARVLTPGAVEVTVIAQPTALGVYHTDTPQARVKALAAAMNAAGAPTVYSEAINTLLWAKVAYNCALNPLSALLDVPYGQLAENEYSRSILVEAIQELYAVAEAKGILMHPQAVEEYQALFFEKLLPPTAAHYASMREDFIRRRPTEIDALNGAIVRYGRAAGIATPVNDFLTRMVHAREVGYLGAGEKAPEG